MKVLFAVDNDNISNAIVKQYQKEYKEIISYKNVYYFNAILKELQNDKTYDRVVISEDLEPFANNNYDTIDKFLFEKLDKISDEATKATGENIDIILICTDRRSKSDEMLTKLFGIGIYNALLGDERNVEKLCELMNQPRTKKEAKLYYKIDGNSIGYQVEDENSVSESEVQNILAHYKRIGKNEDKYVDSFNNIVSQYTDAQLKIIIRYLPLNVKAVLEERSPKYQQLSNVSSNEKKEPQPYKPKNAKDLNQEEAIKVKMLKNQKDRITKPIIIPSTLNNKKTLVKENAKSNDLEKSNKFEDEVDLFDIEKNQETEQVKNVEEVQDVVKKGRGRPRKNPVQDSVGEKPKKGRGRPKKDVAHTESSENDEELDLFNIAPEKNEDVDDELFSITTEENNSDDIDLFNIDEETTEVENINNEDSVDLFNMDEELQDDLLDFDEQTDFDEDTKKDDVDVFNMQVDSEEDLFSLTDDDSSKDIIDEQDGDLFNLEKKDDIVYSDSLIEKTNKSIQGNLNNILTAEKKIVLFVGTTKNGTSFVVNNLALMLDTMNISTAILDTTKSKNAYYIFTKNEEKLRNIAQKTFNNLENGIAEGIKVSKNLTVYTDMPGENVPNQDIDNVLVTLMEKHDVVLIDADFETPIQYFESAQEIYLVQSMDILTIQPLTAFLRNLKSKNVLREERIKIIINKEQKVRTLSDKLLIGGMSSYNSASMSLMTELFNKDNVQYCKIPFEIQNYVKYLDSLVTCELSLRGYTKQLLQALRELAEMVYPLLNKSQYTPPKGDKKNRMQFSNATQNTLDKMKKNY